MSRTSQTVVVSGAFDDIRSPDIRFLQEAARLGKLHVLLWNDGMFRSLAGKEPRFPAEERLYYLEAIRFVEKVHLIASERDAEALPDIDGLLPDVWALRERDAAKTRQAWCRANNVQCRVISQEELNGFPEMTDSEPDEPARPKVLVTGCYDWFHSGHIRFFEEASELGKLYVVVGHDANIRHLKGEGHPMFAQDERRYIVQSIRHVHRTLISTGHGWLDAEPELLAIKPDIYAVNEDGDRPVKRRFCKEHGIKYVVLARTPKDGLPKRTSTDLRGH